MKLLHLLPLIIFVMSVSCGSPMSTYHTIPRADEDRRQEYDQEKEAVEDEISRKKIEENPQTRKDIDAAIERSRALMEDTTLLQP